MREIEFRCYSTSTKKWYYSVAEKNMTLKDLQEGKSGTWKVMQCIGLKDKNGKKICEGHIIRILYTDWPSQFPNKDGKYDLSLEDYKKSISKIGFVDYFAPEYRLQFSEYTGSLLEGRHGEKEIIGNIYDNPELLKEDK